MSDSQLTPAALAFDSRFDFINSCSRCAVQFNGHVIHRRVYDLPTGTALAVLCAPCNEVMPLGSERDLQFRVHLSASWLQHTPTAGVA